MNDILIHETLLALAGSVAATVWTALQAGAWRRRIRDDRFQRALIALEAAVRTTYDAYVRAIKEAREDGKLTDAERREARRRARNAAIAYGRDEGIDIARELGYATFDLWLERVLKTVKS